MADEDLIPELVFKAGLQAVHGTVAIVSSTAADAWSRAVAAQSTADDAASRVADRSIQTSDGSIPGESIISGYADNAVADDIAIAAILGGGSAGRENIIGGDGSATVGTSTPNVASTGTGADYSVITGGHDNVAGGIMSVISGAHNYTAVGTSYGTISGGSGQKITGTSTHSTIGGGFGNTIDGDYSTIAGGVSITITADAAFAAGQGHTVTGTGAFAAGNAHTVSGAGAFAAGDAHIVNGHVSSALGRGGATHTFGQHVVSSLERAVPGDSQSSVIVTRRRTTDDTVSTLGVTGTDVAHTVQEGQTMAMTALVVAREPATGDSAMFEVKLLVKREVGGNSTFVGTPSITQVFASTNAATWTLVAAADSSDGTVALRAVGEAGKTIDWVARQETAEVLG